MQLIYDFTTIFGKDTISLAFIETIVSMVKFMLFYKFSETSAKERASK